MVEIEIYAGEARASGTPAWMIAEPITSKLKQLRALAGEANTLATTVRTLSSKIAALLNHLITDSKTDTCTLLSLLDDLVTQYQAHYARLQQIRAQIDELLKDPEVQTHIKPQEVEHYYKARTENARTTLVRFSTLPPPTPLYRSAFIRAAEDAQNTINVAEEIIAVNEPLIVTDFFNSTEYADIQATIAKLIESRLDDIKALKTGRISEAEFWVRIRADIARIVAEIMSKVRQWQNRNREAVTRVLKAKEDKAKAQATLRAMYPRECPELKQKYNIKDKPGE